VQPVQTRHKFSKRFPGMRYVLALSVLLFASAAEGWSAFYTSVPFSATVIDADSGQPVDGANIFAHWTLHRAQFFDSSTPVAELELFETSSRNDGSFDVEGFTKLNLTPYELRHEDPALVIYKPGYYPAFFSSQYSSEEFAALGPRRVSKLSGKMLRLKLWDGDYPRLNTELSRIMQELGDDTIHSCSWTRVATFIRTVVREQMRLKEANPAQMFASLLVNQLATSCAIQPAALR